VHHHTIQINQPATCNNFPSLLLDVYVWFNMFQASSRPSSRATTAVAALERGGSSAVGCGGASRPDHCYHYVPTVKPEAATAVVELLIMGVGMPETCGAVHKRQVINLGNCCMWLVDLLEM
jgi:hypothetical protein